MSQHTTPDLSAVRVRMAPSPTGRLHIGTARTALFNYLFARRHGGSFVLRIEDTDPERSNPDFERDILEQLQWLGIQWDEGPLIESPKSETRKPETEAPGQAYIGAYGPYRQSERTASYRKCLTKLLAEGKAYWCFCSADELERERQQASREGRAPRYSGRCRRFSPAETAERLGRHESAIARFRTPGEGEVRFTDLVRGELVFDLRNFDDFSIAKDIETPLYNFAVVVDDYGMKISHVIRGEDHISNTPKQLLLIEALGFPRPVYAHLPLILGSDRSKMSKRHGAVGVGEYRERGYLPEALVNFLALLGWNPNTAEEVLSLSELERLFAIEGVQKSGAVFNQDKLDWLNGVYLRKLSDRELAERVLPFLIEAGLVQPAFVSVQAPPAYGGYTPAEKYRAASGREVEWITLEKIAALSKDRMKKLGDIRELAAFFFQEPSHERDLLRWQAMSDDEIKASLGTLKTWIVDMPAGDFASPEQLEGYLKERIEESQKERGSMLWPLRVALTGRRASPPPFAIMAILGKTITLERLDRAMALFAS